MAIQSAFRPETNAGRTAAVNRWRRTRGNSGLLDRPCGGTAGLDSKSLVEAHPGRLDFQNRYRLDELRRGNTGRSLDPADLDSRQRRAEPGEEEFPVAGRPLLVSAREGDFLDSRWRGGGSPPAVCRRGARGLDGAAGVATGRVGF